MKREILCTACTNNRRLREAIADKPPQDIRRVWGEAVVDCLCDLCGVALPIGVTVCAWSYFREDESASMRAWNWEQDYISRVGRNA